MNISLMLHPNSEPNTIFLRPFEQENISDDDSDDSVELPSLTRIQATPTQTIRLSNSVLTLSRKLQDVVADSFSVGRPPLPALPSMSLIAL